MKKKALSLLTLLASSLVTTGVCAKVTYEDALKSEQQLTESRRASAARVPTTGVDPREYQERGTTNEWRTIFDGNTTGSVNIFPSGATEALVYTNAGSFLISRNAPAFTLGTVKTIENCPTGFQETIQANATGTYRNHTVKGEMNPVRFKCNSGSWVYADASFIIQKVMVK